MKYLPFLTGTYSVSPGLVPMRKAATEWDRRVFQIDESYNLFIENKRRCRAENISKYYVEESLNLSTAKQINRYIADQFQKVYPELFHFSTDNQIYTVTNLHTGGKIQWDDNLALNNNNQYLSVFDALCSQVPEDFAVCQLEDDSDWLAAIHLCSPNHWSPEEKIGKPFTLVHAPVAGMQKSFANSFKMLQTVISKEPFTRFAWGLSTDCRLNHHPVPPQGIDEAIWQGRKMEMDVPLYVRTERQNLIGFPESNAFLFTIRTYFYPVDELTDFEKKALYNAVAGMSPESLAYKGMTGSLAILKASFQFA